MAVPTILAAGDVGPARYPLLARRALKMVWTERTQDTLTALESKPDLLIISARLADGPGLPIVEAAKRMGVPALALCRADEWIIRGELLAAGAFDILEHHRGDLVLAEITRRTGLGFARHENSSAKLEVRIRLAEGVEQRVADVSMTRVELLTPSVLPMGAVGAIAILWNGPPLDFWTRVTASEALPTGGARTQLDFVAVPEAEKLVLAGLVEMGLAQAEAKPAEPTPAVPEPAPPEAHDEPIPLEIEKFVVGPAPEPEAPQLFDDLDLANSDGSASTEVGNQPKLPPGARRPKPKPLVGPEADAALTTSSTALGRIQTKSQRVATTGGLVQQEVVRDTARTDTPPEGTPRRRLPSPTDLSGNG